MAARSAKEVIDQAIRDNRVSEWMLYCFSIATFAVGLAVLVAGALKGNAGISIAGTISGGLFVPAMNAARKIRRENIAIRLLEAPLSRADTAKEAADMLRNLVSEILSDRERPRGKP